jgi:hypothetical protein
MAGGDLHVRSSGMITGMNMNDTVDANSKPSGNMTTPVNVEGKTVYMTEAGAARMQELMEFSPRLKVESDKVPGKLWGENDNLDGRTEKHVGYVERPHR